MKVEILYEYIENMIKEATRECVSMPIPVIAHEILGFKISDAHIYDEQKREVEKELGFTLYPWQLNYIWGNGTLQFPIEKDSFIQIRGTGKTTAQILKQLLDEKKVYDFSTKLYEVATGNSIQEMKYYKELAKAIYDKLKQNKNIPLAKCIF